jgi:hypothetical protein
MAWLVHSVDTTYRGLPAEAHLETMVLSRRDEAWQVELVTFACPLDVM